MAASTTSAESAHKEATAPEASGNTVAQDGHVYPSTQKAIIIFSCLLIVLFLVALDRLVIAVAIPQITDEFHSLQDVGWYGSVYLFTSCAFLLLLGKVYSIADIKMVYLGSVIVFEVGSAICGGAPSSTAFIVGRAIAGLGSAGTFQGAILIMVHILPLHKRPTYFGFFGVVFGVASAIGPLLGGALTDGPGWRWCFYINLPCGGAVLSLLFFFLQIPSRDLQRGTWRQTLVRLDPIGIVVLFAGLICLILALQWGGVTYAWSSARVLVLIILAGVLLVSFAGIQFWQKENATTPPKILLHRSILAGMWFSFFIGATSQTLFYFIPIWFQTVKGVTATHAGIDTLPLVIGLSIFAIAAGIITKKIGYYVPAMLFGAILTPIGVGLITTWGPYTNHRLWIPFQAIAGIGLGSCIQQSSLAAQTVLPRPQVAIGASLMMFMQTLGSTIFLNVGNNVLDARLASDLKNVPGLESQSVISTGLTNLRTLVSQENLAALLDIFNTAFRDVWYTVLAVSLGAIFGGLAMEWRSLKAKPTEQAAAKTSTDEVKKEEV